MAGLRADRIDMLADGLDALTDRELARLEWWLKRAHWAAPMATAERARRERDHGA